MEDCQLETKQVEPKSRTVKFPTAGLQVRVWPIVIWVFPLNTDSHQLSLYTMMFQAQPVLKYYDETK